ncbi:MAG: cobalamin biosynthesis protein, partial [Chromatiales bacterium]|nr:cobalamin biosynthesis protein [Chromatiales bacterium]
MPVTEILATALLIDAVVGDPPTVYRRVPHPVAALGHFIAWLERECNAPCRTDAEHIARGGICVIVVVAVAFTTGALVHAIFTDWTGGWLLESVIVSTLFATRSLYEHVQAVAVGLESGLAAGRRAVSHIVGRDPQALDEEAIARAAIESTAENFSDGVVAPVFWYVVGGLPGLCAYKAINTMDSMLGHRNSQFELFGKCAARLDDALDCA